jgi:hypothetical protein
MSGLYYAAQATPPDSLRRADFYHIAGSEGRYLHLGLEVRNERNNRASFLSTEVLGARTAKRIDSLASGQYTFLAGRQRQLKDY